MCGKHVYNNKVKKFKIPFLIYFFFLGVGGGGVMSLTRSRVCKASSSAKVYWSLLSECGFYLVLLKACFPYKHYAEHLSL